MRFLILGLIVLVGLTTVAFMVPDPPDPEPACNWDFELTLYQDGDDIICYATYTDPPCGESSYDFWIFVYDIYGGDPFGMFHIGPGWPDEHPWSLEMPARATSVKVVCIGTCDGCGTKVTHWDAIWLE